VAEGGIVRVVAVIGDGTAEAIHSFALGHAWLTPVVIVLTAGSVALCPVALVVLWVRDRKLRSSVATLLGLTVADKVCHYLGGLRYVARPFVALHFTPLFPHSANNSFPSSTVAFAAVVATVVLLASRRLGIVLVAGTVIIALGCVYVGVHYVEDVLVGGALGIACGAIFWFVLGLPPVGRFLAAIEARLPGARMPT
jgi:membrane-associated phospholipid phosphatase